MMTLDERAEALYSPPHLQLKFDLCGHKSESSAAFKGHKSMKHDLNIPRTAKWEKTNVILATLPSTKQNSSRVTC